MIMSSTKFDALEAATFTGDVIGAVTGNVTGDLTGNVTGNVTGDLTGNVTGDLTGNVTGNVTGNLTGKQILPAATQYAGADAGTLAIDPGAGYASLTKADGVGAYTLAAPGAGNVGKILVIVNGHATAHVVTVTGLAGGATLTFTNVVGAGVILLAVSATVWAPLALGGAVMA
jgi:hypothetical protein